MLRMTLFISFCLVPALAAAQRDGAGNDWLPAMQRVMPIGANCATLDWEPVSYCRFHSKGATLEIWSGVHGPGAILSFDSDGEEGLALLPALQAHFLLAGVALEELNHCMRNSGDFRVQVSGSLFDLHCRLARLAGSLSLEILPEPVR